MNLSPRITISMYAAGTKPNRRQDNSSHSHFSAFPTGSNPSPGIYPRGEIYEAFSSLTRRGRKPSRFYHRSKSGYDRAVVGQERKVYKAGVGISEGSILLLCSSERAITVYYDVIHDAGRDNNRRMAFEALERCSVRLGTREGEGRGANPFGLAKDSLSALFIRIIWPLDNL